MKAFRWAWPVPVVLFCVAMYIGIRLYSSPDNDEECSIKPFDEFAYLPDEASFPIPKVLPSLPWQVETTLSGQEQTTYSFSDVQIKLAQTKNDVQEIWLFKAPDYFAGTLTKEGMFIIYYPESQTWKEVSAKIGDTNLIVRDLFATGDGIVWGGLGSWQEPPFPTTVPVLSRFDETTQRFEAVVGALHTPIMVKHGRLIDAPVVILDKQNVFWIVIQNDGIYRYDPKSQITDWQTNIPETKALVAALAQDGSIYFRDDSNYGKSNFLFRFIPATGETATIEIPGRTWPHSWPQFSGMLVDQQGRLWLGAAGYLGTDGQWYRIHPHPRKNIKHYGEPDWTPPTLIFESSNGLMWYAEDNDMSRFGEGTAWFDPKTGKGCLFTNLASYIVEDSERQLWMIADGKLYRYALEP